MILDDLEAYEKHRHEKPYLRLTRNNKEDIILDEANFGYTPKSMAYLKHRDSMGMKKELS